MNRSLILLLAATLITGCNGGKNTLQRKPVAQVGRVILYYDEIPVLFQKGTSRSDSTLLVQNYINKWAKRELLLQKAEENLSPELKAGIDIQMKETKANLFIYQYQKEMMLQKMDTVISEQELENYYTSNEESFRLNYNIVKALFIKLPVETPNIEKIKLLSRSNDQKDLLQLESFCFQFAEKFDDFNEDWVSMDRLSVELQLDIENEENFLKRNTYYETSDSSSVFLISIRDYRLKSALAPFEYVRNDIKRIIWNARRFEYIQSLENGIYNEALKDNRFKIF